MEEVVMDSRGRITIGEKMAKKYGRKFLVVPMPREILLVPKVKDPLKELQEWGRKAGIGKYSLKQIKKMAEDAAYAEVDRKLARVGYSK
jgi:hypothetical protein